jgi:hypothetical protein
MTSRRMLILALFAVVLSACGTTDPSTGVASTVADDRETSTSESTTSTSESAVVHDVAVPEPEYEAERLLNSVAADESALVHASVVVGSDGMVRFEVVEVVAGEGSPSPSYELESLWAGVTTGDEALLVVSPAGELYSVAVYDSMSGELRSPAASFDSRVWLGLQSSVDGLLEMPRHTCGLVVDDVEYPSLRSLFEAHIAGTTPKQQYDTYYETHNAASREAESIADQGDHYVDEVTGWGVPNDDRAVYRALIADQDVDPSAVVPTVPVFLATKELPGFTPVALVDVEAIEVLGTIGLQPGLHSGDSDYLIAYPGRVAPGHTVTVFTHGDADLAGCVSDELIVRRLLEVGTVIGTASHDAMAGSQRLLIDLPAGRVVGLDRAAIKALDDWLAARISS